MAQRNQRVFGFQNAWACNVKTSVSLMQSSTCAGPGHAAKSGLPKSKASKGPVPLHPLLAEFMLLWKEKTPIFATR